MISSDLSAFLEARFTSKIILFKLIWIITQDIYLSWFFFSFCFVLLYFSLISLQFINLSKFITQLWITRRFRGRELSREVVIKKITITEWTKNIWSNDLDKRLVFRAGLKENKLLDEITAQNSKQNDCDSRGHFNKLRFKIGSISAVLSCLVWSLPEKIDFVTSSPWLQGGARAPLPNSGW